MTKVVLLFGFIAVILAAGVASSECFCPNAKTVDYMKDTTPNAGENAYATIEIDKKTWEVDFKVHNVVPLTNGHIVAGKLDTHADDVATAFKGFVSSYDPQGLWNPNNCELSGIDVPSTQLGVEVERNSDCSRTYTVRYSLVDASKQNTKRCTMHKNGDGQLTKLSCDLTLSSVRAYDMTSPSEFLVYESYFTANLDLSALPQ